MLRKKIGILLGITVAILCIASCSKKQPATIPAFQSKDTIVKEFKKPQGISFEVAGVKLADTLLVTNPAKKVVENKLGKTILWMPEDHLPQDVVECYNHGFIQTVQECYDTHRPLVLTPDHIWLVICQGVSIHVNENYDKLKDVIFLEDKPIQLLIRNDSLEYASKHWAELFNSFSNETKKYTKDDFYSFFVSEFTTTSSIEKTAYQVTLLESYKKGFEYVAETGCGIPSITIAGKKTDWESILEKLKMLDKIGMEKWRSNLEPVIKEFISASEGEIHKEFWKNIYKNAEDYNKFYVSGWIIKFFPYLRDINMENAPYDKETGMSKASEYFFPNSFMDGDRYLLSTITTDNFPSGLSKIELKWNNYITKKFVNMEVYAGFMGIKQYEDKSLEPFISWAVCEEKAKPANHQLLENKYKAMQHKPEYWIPYTEFVLTDSAIYDIKRFKTQEQSISYLRSIIRDSLNKSKSFENFSNDTIEIEILSNGNIGNVTMLVDKENIRLSSYIKNQLESLPAKWFPALTKAENANGMAENIEDLNIKVRVNSVVKIDL